MFPTCGLCPDLIMGGGGCVDCNSIHHRCALQPGKDSRMDGNYQDRVKHELYLTGHLVAFTLAAACNRASLPAVLPTNATWNCNTTAPSVPSGGSCSAVCAPGLTALGNMSVTCTTGSWGAASGSMTCAGSCSGTLPNVTDSAGWPQTCNRTAGSVCTAACAAGAVGPGYTATCVSVGAVATWNVSGSCSGMHTYYVVLVECIQVYEVCCSTVECPICSCMASMVLLF